MAVLTGSRTIYFLAAAILSFPVAGMLVSRPDARTFSRILGIFVFVGFAGLLFVLIFPDMFSAMQMRFVQASASEGRLWNRIYYNSFSFFDGTGTNHILGFGVGAGAPGVVNVLHLPPLFLGESDTKRNLNELRAVLWAALPFTPFRNGALDQ